MSADDAGGSNDDAADVDATSRFEGPLLELEDVHAYYGESHVLEGVTLEVDRGETVALIGRNGVGKTTTLRAALQLTPPREGHVRLRGEEVTGDPTHELAHQGVGWIPEDRRMFEELTVAENIGVAVKDATQVDRKLEYALETFPELREHRDRKAGDLSGGQQQMVAIARGLVGDNELLLVDEPSEGLAPQIVQTVADALERVSDEASLLLVEQNFPLAIDLADRFYLVDNGRVVESGSTDGVTADDERIQRYLA